MHFHTKIIARGLHFYCLGNNAIINLGVNDAGYLLINDCSSREECDVIADHLATSLSACSDEPIFLKVRQFGLNQPFYVAPATSSGDRCDINLPECNSVSDAVVLALEAITSLGKSRFWTENGEVIPIRRDTEFYLFVSSATTNVEAAGTATANLVDDTINDPNFENCEFSTATSTATSTVSTSLSFFSDQWQTGSSITSMRKLFRARAPSSFSRAWRT